MRRTGGTIWTDGAPGLLGIAIALLSCGGARAQGTAPGTLIRNIASLSFEIDGGRATISSNSVATRIDEVLDVQLAPASEDVLRIPSPLPADFAAPFMLTNGGSGTEDFYITGAISGEAARLSVAVDVDRNGTYDPKVDIDIPPGSRSPHLAPGAVLPLLVRFAEPPLQAGVLNVDAHATTGSGAPALSFPGQGDGGSDAIVGKGGAAASAARRFVVGSRAGPAVGAQATLLKSQTVQAPDGSNAGVRGATITYRLQLDTTAGETLADAEIVDPIPAGTTYVPGSIRIDSDARSDALDGDAAHFDGTALHVALGNLTQPTTMVVTFQVKIK